jgi:hypothetical protein
MGTQHKNSCMVESMTSTYEFLKKCLDESSFDEYLTKDQYLSKILSIDNCFDVYENINEKDVLEVTNKVNTDHNNDDVLFVVLVEDDIVLSEFPNIGIPIFFHKLMCLLDEKNVLVLCNPNLTKGVEKRLKDLVIQNDDKKTFTVKSLKSYPGLNPDKTLCNMQVYAGSGFLYDSVATVIKNNDRIQHVCILSSENVLNSCSIDQAKDILQNTNFTVVCDVVKKCKHSSHIALLCNGEKSFKKKTYINHDDSFRSIIDDCDYASSGMFYFHRRFFEKINFQKTLRKIRSIINKKVVEHIYFDISDMMSNAATAFVQGSLHVPTRIDETNLTDIENLIYRKL